MKKLVVFNWKSNPHNAASALKLARTVESSVSAEKNFEVVIAPPFPFLEDVGKVIKKAKLGAQDAFWEDIGSYTGEVSWHQEKHLKVKYVIIGHSERRRYLNETDEMINKKVKAALKAGLKVVLCVGEPERELRIKNYELRIKRAKNYVKKQLEKDLKNIPNSLFKIYGSLIIAYEPVWAIGAGHPDAPEDALEMIKFIKKFLIAKRYTLSPKVLYGGSVDSKNIAKFLKYPEIDGVLVGQASLRSGEIKKIIKCGV